MNNFSEQFKAVRQEVDQANHILLHLHPSPDPDSLGSALAMWHVLRGLGKQVTLIRGDSELPESMSMLPGFDQIVPQSFPEVDQSQFDLFISLDSAEKKLVSSHESWDFADNLKVVVIDHHISNTGYGDINIIDTDAPATSQVLSDMFAEWGVEITPDIAICLFVGIYGDTGGFRYPKTTAKTFGVVSGLVERYPNFPEVLSQMGNQNTPGQLKFRGVIYNSIEVVGRGKVALVAIDYSDIEQGGFSVADTERQEIPNNLISVKDWLVGISLVEKEPGVTYLSFRTRSGDVYPVNKIASQVGGGGHLAAAGARFAGTATEAKQKVVEVLQKEFPDLF